ncbi:hypothetical protein Ahy_A08g037532 isoform C [Arachis hypogaea]|uniref:Uncharacterized protein n=1 Tax=Arachis hypogaea TaxID=3818 RepID=A0A445BR18_ARAHY|nr:hypothetical protein Ahy_A08g037532 isoform C [Arachis hypogaea]
MQVAANFIAVSFVTPASRAGDDGGKTFPSLIKELRREFHASFFVLLETHVSGGQRCGYP